MLVFYHSGVIFFLRRHFDSWLVLGNFGQPSVLLRSIFPLVAAQDTNLLLLPLCIFLQHWAVWWK